VLSSTVYGIWRARNEIKHHDQPKTEEQILKLIFGEVRSKISGKGSFKKTRKNLSLSQNWNLNVNMHAGLIPVLPRPFLSFVLAESL
jgi:hypothetical protein